MFEIKPWNEASKRILDQIVKNGKAFTTDIELPRAFGRRYPELINQDFLTIAWADKKKETVFVTKPNITLIPISSPTSRNKPVFYKFFKI